ncbi:Ankyrin repeat and death-like protein 1A [Alternaria alternata]|nr:Ankyrin repeat and death-like protein 1A [Alternaria alternata]
MDIDIGDVSDPWDSPGSQETADWTFIGVQASSEGSSTSSSELGLYTERAQPSWDSSELEVYTEWAQQLWDTSTLTTGAPATRGLPPRWHSLLLVEPSNHCVYNNMTYRLDRRMECLWGNYGTFACTNKVSELFSRTVSDFFGVLCRQMARDYAMVWEAFYACASADALMNKKLPKDVRREYEHVYNLHDSRARQLVIQAIDQFAEKSARGDYTDVLPLYYATFLLHASGACTKGSGDLKAAMKVFSFFNGYTALFPLRIKVIGLSDNNWTVRMLLANDASDHGMEIHRFSFILGQARRSFDEAEELFLYR